MNYTDLVTAISTYAEITVSGPNADTNFAAVLPRFIEQAENRIYREIDFLVTRQYATTPIGPGTALLAGPSGWLVGRALNLISGGVRKALLRREDTFLQEVWPNQTSYTVGIPPKYWAEISVGTLLIAPAADASYLLEMIFTIRPNPISSSNSVTWLSTTAPDLLFKACMCEVAAYKQNYGQQSDNPQMALSWETAYQTAKASASAEESRRKAEAMFDAVTPPPSSDMVHGA